MDIEILERAKEHFAKVLQEQLDRVERMKKGEEWTDYSKLKPIIIGVVGGDGIGPYIAKEAQRILEFFLQEICGAEYHHEPLLCPSQGILDAFKKKQISWEQYERDFRALLDQRRVEETVDRRLFDVPAVLLCGEPKADRCHRRLAAEYLAEKWGDVRIVHL